MVFWLGSLFCIRAWSHSLIIGTGFRRMEFWGHWLGHPDAREFTHGVLLSGSCKPCLDADCINMHWCAPLNMYHMIERTNLSANAWQTSLAIISTLEWLKCWHSDRSSSSLIGVVLVSSRPSVVLWISSLPIQSRRYLPRS